MPNKYTAKSLLNAKIQNVTLCDKQLTLTQRSRSNGPMRSNVYRSSDFPNHQTGSGYLTKWLRYSDLCENDLDLNFKVTASICQTFSATAEMTFRAIQEVIKTFNSVKK